MMPLGNKTRWQTKSIETNVMAQVADSKHLADDFLKQHPALAQTLLENPAAHARRSKPASQGKAMNNSKYQQNLKQRLAEDLPLIEAQGNQSWCYRAIKRGLDMLAASILIVLLSPILLATLLILTITTRGKPIFVQRRIGYLGKHIPMLKFRTMHVNADKMQHLVSNEHQSGPIFKNKRDPRITRIGRWLRRTSIDELPQLFNVLAGHMSLVGPRPPVEKEVMQYEPWQLRRLAIRPGLTCLWQVSGRSEIGFDDWVRMDIWYSKNQTIWTDIRLLVKTPWSVLTGRGAY